MNRFMPLALVVAMGLGGCASQVPIASTYPYSTQQKMQAVHHWDVLATDAVGQLLQSPAALGPIHVTRHADMPFDQAFHDLLITRLVDAGYTVLEQPRSGAVELSYHAQVVSHGGRGYIRSRAGTFTTLAGGVLVARNFALYSTSNEAIGAAVLGAGVATDVLSGFITSITDTEVLITLSMTQNGQYIARQSSVYYIPPGNTAHYKAAPRAVTKSMGVVNE